MNKILLGQVFYNRDLFVTTIRRYSQYIFTRCLLLTIIVGRGIIAIVIAIITIIVAAVA